MGWEGTGKARKGAQRQGEAFTTQIFFKSTIMQTTKYPLDFDALDKGSVIPQSKIEEVLGMKADHPDLWKKKLRLKERVEGEISFRCGVEVTIKDDHGDLVILTDGQASIYNFTWEVRHIRAAMRSHNRLLAVDSRNLTPDELVEHRKRVEISSKYAQALHTTTRSIVDSSNGRLPLPLPAIAVPRRVI